MARVFLSHANADKALVDDVRAMLQGAVGLQPRDELFYSSGAGTGVPGGQNFVEYIRDAMTDSTFVIAIITPAFLQSAFCLAELGAVWLAAGDKAFFPLCVPSVDRGDLRATLTGIQVERLDERPPLAELLQRVSDHFGRSFNAGAADDQITAFHGILPTRLAHLASPALVPAADLEAANSRMETLGQQLAGARDDAEAARARMREVVEAKTAAEAEQLARAVPTDTRSQLDALIKEARSKVRKIPAAVGDALSYEIRGDAMPWPDRGSYEFDQVREQVDDGLMYDNEDGTVSVDANFPDVEAALESVRDLERFLSQLDPDDQDWFKAQYGVPADLGKGATFRELVR